MGFNDPVTEKRKRNKKKENFESQKQDATNISGIMDWSFQSPDLNITECVWD